MDYIIKIGTFIQNEILGMRWLNNLIGLLLNKIGVDISTRIGSSVQFFIYDTIKIFVLLSVLIFIISYIQSYFPPERTKKILGKFKGIWANVISALLGTITPFCSCSSIPIFMGFTSAGLSMGVTFSFLISSPLVDLGSVILLTSIFGFKVAFAYVIVGLILAVIGGTIIEKMNMEAYIEDIVKNARNIDINIQQYNLSQRLKYAKQQVLSTVKKVYPYIIVGVLIGATIHNFIPQEFVENTLGKDNPFSVIIATVLGVPMYADIFGTIPIAEALLAKGAMLGTILSFMMSVTAISLPSVIMLRKAIKPKLLSLFILIMVSGIIIIGYIFNILL